MIAQLIVRLHFRPGQRLRPAVGGEGIRRGDLPPQLEGEEQRRQIPLITENGRVDRRRRQRVGALEPQCAAAARPHEAGQDRVAVALDRVEAMQDEEIRPEMELHLRRRRGRVDPHEAARLTVVGGEDAAPFRRIAGAFLR